MVKQRLLISVRGKNDAIEAVAGGAHIIDVEYPGSALGTPYPLNIRTVRRYVQKNRLVATNIGEKQHVWATASQAALGVAISGADIIKVGLAGLRQKSAGEVMKRVVRNVTKWKPDTILIAGFFVENELRAILDPMTQSQIAGVAAGADGILIDTYFKDRGKGLLDYLTLIDIEEFAQLCHNNNLEAWVAGSITKEQMPNLWRTEVDVICIRGAATDRRPDEMRMGKVRKELVQELIQTLH